MKTKVSDFRNQVAELTNKHPSWGVADLAGALKCSSPDRVRRALGWLQKNRSDSVPQFDPSNPMVRSDVLQMLRRKKSGVTSEDIAGKLCTTVNNAKEVVSHLTHHDGYNITPGPGGVYCLSEVLPPVEPLSIKVLRGREIQFGLLSDTHICNEHERLDVLEAAYDIYAKQGIKQVYHAGNIIDGEFKFNRYELRAHGVQDQCNYLADHYPQRSGIKTYFISAECHEGWWQKDTGLRIGWYIQNWCEEKGRKDLIHIGHLEQDVVFQAEYGSFRMRIMHPGDGTPYAISYPSQKMVESFQGGEKPQVLVLGHYHKFDMSYPREVLTIMPGCVEDQTPFMRKRKIGAHVGFCICTLGVRQDGTLGRFGCEWIPFYDREYHQRLNGYPAQE